MKKILSAILLFLLFILISGESLWENISSILFGSAVGIVATLIALWVALKVVGKDDD